MKAISPRKLAGKGYWWSRQHVRRLRRRVGGWAYRFGEGKRLRPLKNIHAGERCFIIGNGPSLKQHDLTKLAGERKFATNMFPLHPQFDQINLDYYCASDYIHWSVNGGFTPVLRRAFRQLPQCAFFFEYSCKRVWQKSPELRGRQVFLLFLDESHSVSQGYFGTDVDKRVWWGWNVVTDFCLPLAHYMGFEKVYLIGCDYDWHGGASNKFVRSYFYEIDQDDRQIMGSRAHSFLSGSEEHLREIMAGLAVVKRFFESTGRRIYNAGYGGKLEIFPRVDYDKLF